MAALLVGWLWNQRLAQTGPLGSSKERWSGQPVATSDTSASAVRTNALDGVLGLIEGIPSGMAQSKEAGAAAQTRGERTGHDGAGAVPPVAED